MIKTGVAFRWPVTRDDTDGSSPPERELEPLGAGQLDVRRRKTMEAYVEIAPAGMWIVLNQFAYHQRPDDRGTGGEDIEHRLSHCSKNQQRWGRFPCNNSRIKNSLGRHFLGRISLGTLYVIGIAENPTPMSVWAAIRR